MSTSNIQIHPGSVKVLPATATGVFHSASSIQKGALGAITFELRSPAGKDPNQPFETTVVIGTVTMPSDFGVAPGKNVVVANVSLIKDGTKNNSNSIASFVDKYAEGTSQEMELFGPIHHPTTMLNGFLTQRITAQGIANPNLVVGSILTQASVAGYKAQGSLPTVDSDGKMRGAVAVAGNPFDANIKMENVLYDIYLHEPIEYTLAFGLWTGIGKTLHCPKTNKFSRSSFGKGMHMYDLLCPGEKDGKACPASNANLDYVEFQPKQQMSFLSPAYPMPDQIQYEPDGALAMCKGFAAAAMPKLDCCYLSIFAAAACRALKRGDAHFLTHTNGTMDLTVGEFQTTSSISQKTLSFTFEAALLDGWKLAGVVEEVPKCSDFTIL